MAVNPNEELKMTYTSVLTKEGKPHISLLFERGTDYCEGAVPSCTITKNHGFSEEEVEALTQYLISNKKQIIEQSKGISGFASIFG